MLLVLMQVIMNRLSCRILLKQLKYYTLCFKAMLNSKKTIRMYEKEFLDVILLNT